MVQWKKLFGLDNQDRHGFRDEMRRCKYYQLYLLVVRSLSLYSAP